MLSSLAGCKIIESPDAFKRIRVRTYPRSHAKSPRHWRRMDKKWRKRYGFYNKPVMFQMFDTLFVHPALMPTLRRQFQEST